MPRRWMRRALHRAVTPVLLLTAQGCSDRAEPGVGPGNEAGPATGPDSGWILSLSPDGTRALLAMGLADRIAVADAESQALLPEPPALEPLPDRPPPKLALVPPLFDRLAPEIDAWLARAERVVVVDPHDLDDARRLYDEIGEAVGEPERAEATRRRVADLLGPIGAASSGRERPCVVVVVALEPLTLAGGHSFESNVLELLGAESATHDLREANRLAASRAEIRALAPDLVVVAADDLAPAALAAFGRDLAPLDVVPTALEPSALWLADRAAAEPQLAVWSSLVARARDDRARTPARANCARSASIPAE